MGFCKGDAPTNGFLKGVDIEINELCGNGVLFSGL